MGNHKDEKGTTRVGDWLRSIGSVGKPILNFASKLTGQEWLSSVADGIKNSDELSVEEKKIGLELHQLDAVDRANARHMAIKIQEAANASWLAKNTAYILDLGMFALVTGIIIGLFTLKIPEGNENTLYMVLGVIVGICGTVYAFHRGSSQGSKSKTEKMVQDLQSNLKN